MRASRLVNLLLTLQARGRATAEELAAELEVSVRTIYRDLDALCAAGVPLYGRPGAGGGYQLVEGYQTRLTGLNAAEAEALMLVDLSGPLRALGLDGNLLAARLKLAAALPAAVRARAGSVAGWVHLDLPGWFEASELPPSLPAVAAAVLAEQRLSFDYGPPGKQKGRQVDPLGLVLKGSSWYLVARRGARLLTYAVWRIHGPEAGVRFERPGGFDLAAAWDRLVTEFEEGLPRVEVTVRVRAPAAGRLRRLLEPRARAALDSDVAPDSDGWRSFTVTFERLEYARQNLLSLGSDVEVLAPASLRDEMAAEVAALQQLYGTVAVRSG